MHRARLNKIRNRCNSLHYTVETLKRNKERADSLQQEIDSRNQLISLSSLYLEILGNVLLKTRERYSSYQKDRIKFLEVCLESNIAFLFPDRGFVPHIDYNIVRKKIKSKLILTDPDNNVRTPEITEGDFLQQLIGYTSSISILKLLNCKTFYIDEAFSNASAVSKEKMQPIIYNYTVRDGLQTIMISQSNECYADLPRREFHLKYEDNECKLVDVIDYDLDYDISAFDEMLDLIDVKRELGEDTLNLTEDDVSYLSNIHELE